MNVYACLYGGNQIDVEADTSYQAQLKGHEHFQNMLKRKKIKSYEVSVILIEKDGKDVIHNGAEL